MSAKIHYMGDGNEGPRGGKLYVFHCPGCEYGHPFEVCAPAARAGSGMDRSTSQRSHRLCWWRRTFRNRVVIHS